MRKRSSLWVAMAMVAGVLFGAFAANTPLSGRQASGYKAPRSPYADGKPDLNGIYQALNFANYDLRDHSMRPGAFWQLGALGGTPPGRGVVEGGSIPYQPWATKRQEWNYRHRLIADVYKPEMGDPELKCYLPGTPRAVYMPYPFQILQSTNKILIAYEFAGVTRTIHLDTVGDSPSDTWMGWSRGRWEGETLVVDVTDFNDQTWFDRAGNFHSEALHVVERYTPVDPYHLMYEATIEDPKVFTRPWTLKMPLYRHVDQDKQIREYKCVEFVEELMYGHLGVIDPATGEANK